jgi:hypothetical protein
LNRQDGCRLRKDAAKPLEQSRLTPAAKNAAKPRFLEGRYILDNFSRRRRA